MKGVAMLCELSNWNVQSQESTLIIKEMNQDLSVWSIPITYGFESTPENMSIYTQRHHETLEQIDIYHLSSFIADKAVCSLTVSLLGTQYARIDDVATLPAYQSRGYATQLIQFTLNFLKKKNN
jgi:GNAT superfamily N-acetyltransferase